MVHYYPERPETYIKKDAQDLVIFKVKGDVIMEGLGLSESEPILNCQFNVYAPQIFSGIVCNHFKRINFAEALNLKDNAAKIKKLSEKESSDGGGGKSGEFFFLTDDRKIILKTTSPTESKLFMEIMADYGNHFARFPNSQIGRIFGLFEIIFENTGKSIKLFMMEALDSIHPGTLRKYDLKGSTSDRKVLSHFDSFDLSSPIKDVLKDNDFDFLETNISLKTESRTKLLNSLKADISFFRLHSIIDYSLLISVVDMSSLPEGYIMEELK